MEEEKNLKPEEENAQTEADMEKVSGGIYTLPGGCHCSAPRILKDGQFVCSRCGFVYGLQIP